MIAQAKDFGTQVDVPELLPARMLNEYTYCPRLAYLEWVQGEFADNLETMEGTFGHRRVDVPGRTEIPVPQASKSKSNDLSSESASTVNAGGQAGNLSHEGGAATIVVAGQAGTQSHVGAVTADDVEAAADSVEIIHARSIMLSAPGEGLLAKLDLLEVEGPIATPVDYKRGSIPDVPGRAWEPEKVQLCAQGLILRENGFESNEGILFYIESHRRVSVPFDDELIARTRTLAQEFRAVAAGQHIPPPLVDSPKCPRCSLVGICLPDETHLLSIGALEDEETESQPTNGVPVNRLQLKPKDEIRKLIPTRDDAMPLYVNEQGAMLGKSADRLEVKKAGKLIQSVRLIDVSQVSIFGNAQVTSQALRELAARGVPICYFSYGGWFYAMTGGLLSKNVDLRIHQYAVAADPIASLQLAKSFVEGKIRNCRTLLRRNLESDPDGALDRLADFAKRSLATDNAASLLGLEGMAAKVYFESFARLLKESTNFSFETRNRRPPTDPVNALLSFVYAMMSKELTIAVQSVGLDPMLGFYHRPRFGRPSLALDLAEEFRPLIADSTVLSLINGGEVSSKDFLHQAGAVALTTTARKTVIGAYERRMDQLVTHPIFGYRISYRRLLQVQARLLGRVLLGELPAYPSFQTR